jgi:hypothetical protein
MRSIVPSALAVTTSDTLPTGLAGDRAVPTIAAAAANIRPSVIRDQTFPIEILAAKARDANRRHLGSAPKCDVSINNKDDPVMATMNQSVGGSVS